MCLSKVIEKYDSPSSVIISGWKEFNDRSGKLEFQNQANAGSRAVPLDTWIKAVPTVNSIRSDDGKSYVPGFHVYENEDIRKASRRRVYARLITCRGEQDRENLVIATEIYVPSDPDAWPPKPGDKSKPSLMDKVRGKVGNA